MDLNFDLMRNSYLSCLFKLCIISLLSSLLFSISGCSQKAIKINKVVSVDLLPPDNDKSLPNLPLSESNIFSLSKSQEDHFLTYLARYKANEIGSNEAIKKYLEEELPRFDYDLFTYSAEKTYALRKGNCMSLGILTTALAKLANVDFSFRLMLSNPVYDDAGGIITSARHVKTLLFESAKDTEEGESVSPPPLIGFRDAIVVDYFATREAFNGLYIGYNDFLSLYYQNAASEALQLGEVEVAYNYAYKGYQVEPKSLSGLNILAVISNKMGFKKQAENIYRAVITFDNTNYIALKNYSILLKQQHRWREYKVLQQRYISANDPNPFLLIAEAKEAEANERYELSKRLYLKAIKKAPYLLEPYVLLSKLNDKLQRESQQNYHLYDALKWIDNPEDRLTIKEMLYTNLK
ncbi:tetratricopeptide repeat protein [Thalassotalea hakodatensis]|uniref:hypothetical protein n=1 Tax=Thalassotalea hakodatensis TaxID=3030492 RepID=UPI002572BBD9|nr:hypothetical protein [Thalassotalea hakodatensis]